VDFRRSNGTEQAEYLIPFCAPYLNFRTGDFVYISGQITSDTGDLTCEIRHNNRTIAQGYASSFANIAETGCAQTLVQ
jgi:hypothetical protein